MLVNGRIYQKYDIGYNVAHFTRNHPLAPITIVGVSGIINNLQFHANSNVLYAESVPDLDKFDREFIIIKKDSDITLPYNSQIIGEYDGLPMEKFIPSLFNPKAYSRNLQQVKLVFIP
jgi:hypothetical protein